MRTVPTESTNQIVPEAGIATVLTRFELWIRNYLRLINIAHFNPGQTVQYETTRRGRDLDCPLKCLQTPMATSWQMTARPLVSAWMLANLLYAFTRNIRKPPLGVWELYRRRHWTFFSRNSTCTTAYDAIRMEITSPWNVYGFAIGMLHRCTKYHPKPTGKLYDMY